MKQKLIGLIAIFTFTLFFESCATCDDCEVSPAAKQIIVVNSSGDNLIFGVSSKYDYKDIEIKNSAGDIIDFLPNETSGSIDFAFNLNFDKYFIKLTSSDTDTLSFTFGKDKHIDCCKEFDVTETTSVNGKSVINDDRITITK